MRRGAISAVMMAALLAMPTDVPKVDGRPTHSTPHIPPEQRPGRERTPAVETNPEGRAARRRAARAKRYRL